MHFNTPSFIKIEEIALFCFHKKEEIWIFRTGWFKFWRITRVQRF